MKNKLRFLLFLFTSLVFSFFTIVTSVYAHFGSIIPSTDIVGQGDPPSVVLNVAFLHPMEQELMNMAKPKQFAVVRGGLKSDLLPTLKETKENTPDQNQSVTRWRATYTLKRPGDYTFFMEPQPYWEPTEDTFIIHYTKVCVHGFGLEQGWDQPVGLTTEIIPLTRPYGLWTNNLFTGQVLLNGQPVPFAEVEVEYLNGSKDNSSLVTPPSAPFVTQVIKADGAGIFSYAMPRQGWWGFAALNQAQWKLPHDGTDKNVELGAVYWVHTRDME
ncbi:DUF4198 domain-containing protein [Desulfogranum marinum]|uniref:DUF4198 domain-containing protein n=1 Tax=Desulfogranum marinum TaxID=453220 RepID=UPI001E3F425B|nr:DUF4198 domain-containing protein [Desulfogranum marinum]